MPRTIGQHRNDICFSGRHIYDINMILYLSYYEEPQRKQEQYMAVHEFHQFHRLFVQVSDLFRDLRVKPVEVFLSTASLHRVVEALQGPGLWYIYWSTPTTTSNNDKLQY